MGKEGFTSKLKEGEGDFIFLQGGGEEMEWGSEEGSDTNYGWRWDVKFETLHSWEAPERLWVS